MNALYPRSAMDGREPWDRLASEHRAALHEILNLAAKYPQSGALDGCRSWAERTLRQLIQEDRNPSQASLSEWGRNGKGPAIRSQLHSARTFAELIERRARRAA